MSTGFYHPNSMDPLITDIQDAQDYANLAKDWAIKMDGPVEGASYSSQWNATLSAQSASDAAGSANDALGYSNLAQEWAENPENVFISGTSSYSAYHWALQSQEAATNAEQSATDAQNAANSIATATFIDLPDTPADYSGQALQALRVNAAEDAMEFYTPSGGGITLPTVVTESTTSRTLSTSDNNSYIRFTNAGAVTVTVPDNATEAFAIGDEVHLRAVDVGGVTVSPAGGVTVNAPSSGGLVLAEAGATATLKKVGTDEWDLFGLVSA